jgi:hypothetical protein
MRRRDGGVIFGGGLFAGGGKSVECLRHSFNSPVIRIEELGLIRHQSCQIYLSRCIQGLPTHVAT